MPIRRSSVANNAANRSVSSSSAAGRGRPRPSSMAVLAAASAAAGPSANCCSHAGAAGTAWPGGTYPVHQPDLVGFGRGQPRTAEDQLLGLGGPDEPGQALRAAGAGDNAEEDFGQADRGVGGADPVVRGERESVPAAEELKVFGKRDVQLAIFTDNTPGVGPRWSSRLRLACIHMRVPRAWVAWTGW